MRSWTSPISVGLTKDADSNSAPPAGDAAEDMPGLCRIALHL